MASSRLAVPESVFEAQLTARAAPRSDARRPGRADASQAGTPRARTRDLSGREDTERAFLALCIASPDDGARALASADVEDQFSSELLRRAANWLRDGDLREPMSEAHGQTLDGDPQLKALLAELVVQAGREQADPSMLEVQRLQLELAQVDRQIQRARGRDGGDVNELAHHRAQVKLEFDRAYGRVLERTGDREG